VDADAEKGGGGEREGKAATTKQAKRLAWKAFSFYPVSCLSFFPVAGAKNPEEGGRRRGRTHRDRALAEQVEP